MYNKDKITGQSHFEIFHELSIGITGYATKMDKQINGTNLNSPKYTTTHDFIDFQQNHHANSVREEKGLI